MLCMKHRRSVNFHSGAFTVPVFQAVILLSLTRSCRGQSTLVCPSQPVVALVGDDVILPCRLEPPISATSRTVEWTRPGLDPEYIHVRQDGRLVYHSQNPSYNHRTTLFVDQLINGNVSLKVSRVKLSDSGRYRCFIPSLRKEASIRLSVGAVSSPVVSIAGTNTSTGGVELQCESEGWYPEPEVLWLDAEGNLLPAGPTETVRGPDDLYTVSSRVTVEKRHRNSFTCRVQQKDINQTRETHIHVSDGFFPTSASPSPSSSVPVIVGLVLGFVFILVVVFVLVLWKWRQNKLKKKKIDSESPDPSAEPLMTRDTNGDMDVDIRIRPASEATGLTEETHQRQTNNVQTQGQMEFQDRGRQTNQVPSGGETVHGLDQETDSEPAEEQRETPDPAGRDTARETREDVDMRIHPASETTQVSNSESPDPSAESLMRRDTDGDTVKNVDTRIRPSSETTGLTEETHQRQTNNVQIQERDTQQEQPIEERKTENDLQTEEEEKSESAETETVNDVDTEKDKLQRKLQRKETEIKNFEKNISRKIGLKKEREKRLKELRLQLEEVERQREETERKMESVNREEDMMKTQREAAEEEEGEAVKRLLDSRKDLERKKEELQKQLEKLEKVLERNKKEVINDTERKIKATREKEEIIKKIEEMEKQRRRREAAKDEGQSDSDEDL